MKQEKINRINVLAKKKKTVGLSKEEALEQKVLRDEYIQLFRRDLINKMDYISVQDEDGHITHMKDVRIKKDIE
jgi:uncharacterized protein YnzC (UPF0291/DUF896 family)